MKDETKKILTKAFSKKLVKKRKVAGRTFSYIEGASVIQRLNEAFGYDWSFEVVDRIVDIPARQIAILGRINITGVDIKTVKCNSFQEMDLDNPIPNDRTGFASYSEENFPINTNITKQQWGSAPIQCYKGTDTIIDLGNDLKAATTDALKKCATLLGVALYLYHEDEVVVTFDYTEKDIEEMTEKEKERLKEEIAKKTPIEPSQVQAIVNVLNRAKVEPRVLLKFVKIKSLDELTKAEASDIINGKHKFWNQGK